MQTFVDGRGMPAPRHNAGVTATEVVTDRIHASNYNLQENNNKVVTAEHAGRLATQGRGSAWAERVMDWQLSNDGKFQYGD
jgi:hypothetical protein